MVSSLSAKIESKGARLAVIGLGYVGLPVACTFAAAGFSVTGVDILAERVDEINAGRSPISGNEPGLADLLAGVVASGKLRATIDYEQILGADIVFIIVETPVGEDHKPKYQALGNACRRLGPTLKKGALVIVESTIAPGTMAKVVQPILEAASGWSLNQGFYLGHCPERVMPGKLLANIAGVSRVCGGSTPETSEAMIQLYLHVVNAELDAVDLLTAELVKTMENAYRDVQIAFANEMALLCEALSADVWQVRELVNKSPGRHMLLPGAGVGGHCIPKDGWLLIANAPEEFEAKLIPAARVTNDGMPHHVVSLLRAALEENHLSLADARIIVLGYAYRENSDDTRLSPSKVLVMALREKGARVVIHDPWVSDYMQDPLVQANGCDAAILMVAHQYYRELDWVELGKALTTPILIDGRRLFDATVARELGFLYYGVGIGSQNG